MPPAFLWLPGENINPTWADAQTHQHQSTKAPGGRACSWRANSFPLIPGHTDYLPQSPSKLSMAMCLSTSHQNGDANDGRHLPASLLETSMLCPLLDNLDVTLDNGRMSGRADSGSLTDGKPVHRFWWLRKWRTTKIWTLIFYVVIIHPNCYMAAFNNCIWKCPQGLDLHQGVCRCFGKL